MKHFENHLKIGGAKHNNNSSMLGMKHFENHLRTGGAKHIKISSIVGMKHFGGLFVGV